MNETGQQEKKGRWGGFKEKWSQVRKFFNRRRPVVQSAEAALAGTGEEPNDQGDKEDSKTTGESRVFRAGKRVRVKEAGRWVKEKVGGWGRRRREEKLQKLQSELDEVNSQLQAPVEGMKDRGFGRFKSYVENLQRLQRKGRLSKEKQQKLAELLPEYKKLMKDRESLQRKINAIQESPQTWRVRELLSRVRGGEKLTRLLEAVSSQEAKDALISSALVMGFKLITGITGLPAGIVTGLFRGVMLRRRLGRAKEADSAEQVQEAKAEETGSVGKVQEGGVRLSHVQSLARSEFQRRIGMGERVEVRNKKKEEWGRFRRLLAEFGWKFVAFVRAPEDAIMKIRTKVNRRQERVLDVIEKLDEQYQAKGDLKAMFTQKEGGGFDIDLDRIESWISDGMQGGRKYEFVEEITRLMEDLRVMQLFLGDNQLARDTWGGRLKNWMRSKFGKGQEVNKFENPQLIAGFREALNVILQRHLEDDAIGEELKAMVGNENQVADYLNWMAERYLKEFAIDRVLALVLKAGLGDFVKDALAGSDTVEATTTPTPGHEAVAGPTDHAISGDAMPGNDVAGNLSGGSQGVNTGSTQITPGITKHAPGAGPLANEDVSGLPPSSHGPTQIAPDITEHAPGAGALDATETVQDLPDLPTGSYRLINASDVKINGVPTGIEAVHAGIFPGLDSTEYALADNLARRLGRTLTAEELQRLHNNYDSHSPGFRIAQEQTLRLVAEREGRPFEEVYQEHYFGLGSGDVGRNFEADLQAVAQQVQVELPPTPINEVVRELNR